jgi:hypothetical protein
MTALIAATILSLATLMPAVPNRWDYLAAAAAFGVHAHLALGAATVGQGVYVSASGSQFLDIVQVGAKRDASGRHLFAAWGRGVPNGVGSLYVEQDLGPVNTRSHAYTLRLIAATWVMSVDGAVRLRVPDTFRTWRIQSVKAANESETGGALGGTKTSPVRVALARVWRSGAWRLPAIGYWYSGGYRVPAATRESFGDDWMSVVWMSADQQTGRS